MFYVKKLFTLVFTVGYDKVVVRLCGLFGFISTKFVVPSSYQILGKIFLLYIVVFVIVRIDVSFKIRAL